MCILVLKRTLVFRLIAASTRFSLAKTYYLVFVSCALLVQSRYLSPWQVFRALSGGKEKVSLGCACEIKPHLNHGDVQLQS